MNALVYELYGLTEEEIRIVEEGGQFGGQDTDLVGFRGTQPMIPQGAA